MTAKADRCALENEPFEIGPNTLISTTRIAPVGIMCPGSATATHVTARQPFGRQAAVECHAGASMSIANRAASMFPPVMTVATVRPAMGTCPFRIAASPTTAPGSVMILKCA